MHTLNLNSCEQLTDVSALAGCAALHTISLACCERLRDVSGLSGCAALHTLDLSECDDLSDVSALGGCAALQRLDLSCCAIDGPVAGRLRETTHARPLELLRRDGRVGWEAGRRSTRSIWRNARN